MTWTVELERYSNIKLNPQKVYNSLESIAQVAQRNQKLGFMGEVIEVGEPTFVVDGGMQKARYRARIRLKVQATKVAVWGTCNNDGLLQRFHDGALWSRFTHKLRCVRPSRELLRTILLREVAERPEANPLWAEKALEFGWDILQARDPREIIGLLDGRDRLLTGEYQADYLTVRGAPSPLAA
jgi:hypothetical protein